MNKIFPETLKLNNIFQFHWELQESCLEGTYADAEAGQNSDECRDAGSRYDKSQHEVV